MTLHGQKKQYGKMAAIRRAEAATRKRERKDRIRAMWKRFLPIARAAGHDIEYTSDPVRMRNVILGVTSRGQKPLPGLEPRNGLEAGDIAAEFVGKPCKPCSVVGGAKVHVIAARMEAGEELFHENDNVITGGI